MTPSTSPSTMTTLRRDEPGLPGLSLTGGDRGAGGLDLTMRAHPVGLGKRGATEVASRKLQYPKITQCERRCSVVCLDSIACRNPTSAEIRGLVNGVNYTVELKAVTAAGESTAVSQPDDAGYYGAVSRIASRS